MPHMNSSSAFPPLWVRWPNPVYWLRVGLTFSPFAVVWLVVAPFMFVGHQISEFRWRRQQRRQVPPTVLVDPAGITGGSKRRAKSPANPRSLPHGVSTASLSSARLAHARRPAQPDILEAERNRQSERRSAAVLDAVTGARSAEIMARRLAVANRLHRVDNATREHVFANMVHRRLTKRETKCCMRALGYEWVSDQAAKQSAHGATTTPSMPWRWIRAVMWRRRETILTFRYAPTFAFFVNALTFDQDGAVARFGVDGRLSSLHIRYAHLLRFL